MFSSAKKFKYHARSIIQTILLLALVGCVQFDKSFNQPFPDLGRESAFDTRISAFLVLKDTQGPAIRLEVANLEIRAENVWLPLQGEPILLDSAKIGSGQQFLGGQALPAGRYDRLRFTLTKAELKNADGNYVKISVAPLEVEVHLNESVILERDDSRCVLVTWDVESSLQSDQNLRLTLSANEPLRQLPGDLVYVSCPSIDTVFVVRVDKNWVVDSFGLKGGPTYLALNPNQASGRLYVLASRDQMIKVVDLSSYRVIDFFPTPLSDSPTYMGIHSDGRGGYLLDVLDERSGYLTRMDLYSGQSVVRRLVDYRPKYLCFVDEYNMLAVSLSLSQEILLLDPLSLSTKRSISVGNLPQGLAVADGQLFVAESGDNTVSIINLLNGGVSRFSAGFGPRRLQVSEDQIFVSNYLGGSLSLLELGQLGVFRQISGLGRPQEMALNSFYRKLYVTEEESASLAIIDVNINQIQGHIGLGATPFGLAITQ